MTVANTILCFGLGPLVSDEITRKFFVEERKALLARLKIFIPLIIAVTIAAEIVPFFSEEFPHSPGLSIIEGISMLATLLVVRKIESRLIVGLLTVNCHILAAAYIGTACAQSGGFASPHAKGVMIVLAFLLPLPVSLMEAMLAFVGSVTAWFLVTLFWTNPTSEDYFGIATSIFYFAFLGGILVGGVYQIRRSNFRRHLNEYNLAKAHVDLKSAQSSMVSQARLVGLGTLISGVAHEIGNPLNSVINGIEVLKERLDKTQTIAQKTGSPLAEARAEILKMVQFISDGAERILDIIENMRCFLDGDEIHHRLVCVYHPLLATIRLMGETMSEQEIAVRTELEGDPQILGHQGQLQQIFTNVIVNAVHAMKNGGEFVISGMEKENTVEIRFLDTGPGIPAPNKEAIFDPFFTTKEPGKGTGLGLSISRDLARKHGGNLTLESSTMGACFSLTLPLATRRNKGEQ